MRSKVYRQYDSRWGKLPYKNKSNVSGSGCGLVAITHCCIEQDKYKSKTPKYFHSYMRQYAVDGNGTLWSGIFEALKHYGFKNVKWFRESAPMSDVIAELNKGGRIGVILFNSKKAPDGTHFTTSGHYVAFTDYKVKNGGHYFYLKDSGSRKHDGWFCYEKSMKGCCPQFWTCTLPNAKTYDGEFPDIIVTESKPKRELIADKARELAYPYGTASKKSAYLNGVAKKEYKEALKEVYPDKSGWGTATSKGASCDVFVGTCVRASGVDEDFPRGGAGQTDWVNKHPELWEKVSFTKANALNGAILRYGKPTKANPKAGHVCIVVDGKIAEAGYKHYYGKITNTLKTRLSTKGKKNMQIWIPVGEVTVKRNVLKKGDKGEEVKKLQSFLNWYGGYKLTSGTFGDKTVEAVKAFQKAEGLTADGKFGAKSLARAKAVKK